MIQILLLGKDGQIGWELERALAPLGPVLALGRDQLDLTQPARLRQAVAEARAQVIVNAAAYTAVDRAEAETGLAEQINAQAPGVLAEAARRSRAVIIHFSTDYVFDGRRRRPYREDDLPRPLNHYGATKLRGEQAVQAAGGTHLILRTSWVYSLRRPCFVSQVLRWSRTQDIVRVAADQVGSPTWCRVPAQAVVEILAGAGENPWDSLSRLSGVYHVACSGSVSRLDWAREILRRDPRPSEQRVTAGRLAAARSRDFPAPARRPAYSALDSSRLCQVFGLALPDWRQALQQGMSSE